MKRKRGGGKGGKRNFIYYNIRGRWYRRRGVKMYGERKRYLEGRRYGGTNKRYGRKGGKGMILYKKR